MVQEIVEVITDEQIRALRAEALAAGDYMVVYVCGLALGGDDDAAKAAHNWCAKVIKDARALHAT